MESVEVNQAISIQTPNRNNVLAINRVPAIFSSLQRTKAQARIHRMNSTMIYH